MPSNLLDAIFGWAEDLGMGVELGVPYDDRWWRVLSSNEPLDLQRYLARALASTQNYMSGAAQWVQRPAFRGWYLPYEIEQYSWAARARQELLGPWLRALVDISVSTSGRVPGISTYLSQLRTDGDLAALWMFILDACVVHPMIQDGVGENGLSNYAALEPLHRLLSQRSVEFDLVVEIFENRADPHLPDAPFLGHSADYGRVHAQLRVAQHYGARHVVAFALDPWMIDPSAKGSARLLARWQAVYGRL